MVLVKWGLKFDVVGDMLGSGLVEERLGFEVVREECIALMNSWRQC